MPHLAPVVAASLIAGGTTLAGTALSSRANGKAAKTQDLAQKRAEAIEIDNENRRRQEYDRAEALRKAQYDEEQQRRAPYRAVAQSILAQNARRMGYSVPGPRPPAPYTPVPYDTVAAASIPPKTLAQYAGR